MNNSLNANRFDDNAKSRKRGGEKQGPILISGFLLISLVLMITVDWQIDAALAILPFFTLFTVITIKEIVSRKIHNRRANFAFWTTMSSWALSLLSVAFFILESLKDITGSEVSLADRLFPVTAFIAVIVSIISGLWFVQENYEWRRPYMYYLMAVLVIVPCVYVILKSIYIFTNLFGA